MIGTLAAFACAMASRVWGMTPSSAATTMIAMSVTRAPRARIAVNASWPGRVEEDDALAVVIDLAGADVLGDAAALAGRDLGRAEGVEQAGLAVVDVTHDRDDRGARLERRRVVLLEEGLLGRLRRGALGLAVGPGAVRRRGDGLGHLVAELATRPATRCRGR